MPSLSFSVIIGINLGVSLTVQDIKNRYLSGIPLPESITEEQLNFFLQSSISDLENFLGVKVFKTIIKEDRDFFMDDWRQWGFIKTTYPVFCPIKLEGYLGNVKQISYPRAWLSSRRTNDNKNYSRLLHIVPTTSSTHSEAFAYSGIVPQTGYFGSKQIPNYWKIEYVTGWNLPPSEILDVIGMLCSVKILQPISDALMLGTVRKVVDQNGNQVLQSNGSNFGGVGFGLSSKSISIDGLSQSYSSYVNGTTGVWGARLKQYGDMLNTKEPSSLLNRLYDMYGAIVMSVG